MNIHPLFIAATDEPVPSLAYVGKVPAMVFGETPDDFALYLQEIPDLDVWLRELGRRCNEFAELVEVRAMGAAS